MKQRALLLLLVLPLAAIAADFPDLPPAAQVPQVPAAAAHSSCKRPASIAWIGGRPLRCLTTSRLAIFKNTCSML